MWRPKLDEILLSPAKVAHWFRCWVMGIVLCSFPAGTAVGELFFLMSFLLRVAKRLKLSRNPRRKWGAMFINDEELEVFLSHWASLIRFAHKLRVFLFICRVVWKTTTNLLYCDYAGGYYLRQLALLSKSFARNFATCTPQCWKNEAWTTWRHLVKSPHNSVKQGPMMLPVQTVRWRCFQTIAQVMIGIKYMSDFHSFE